MARIILKDTLDRTPDIDRAKLDATTESDIRGYMREDGFDPDASLSTVGGPCSRPRTCAPSMA